MDYDNYFKKDIDDKFFYTDYPGNKLMIGKISLKNAIERLKKNEYYVLVTYGENEELPQQYRPLHDLTTEEGILFATINTDIRFSDICKDGGIQRITQLGMPGEENPKYLLGPGPATISLDELIMEQYNKYYGKETVKRR